MDKKNTTLGVLFLLAAFAALYFANKNAPVPAPQPAAAASQSATAQAGTPAATSSTPAPLPSASTTLAAVTHEDKSARSFTLANDFIEVHFTDFGGAVQNVALKKYPATLGSKDPYILNELHSDPILAITGDALRDLDRTARYEVVSSTSTEIVFRAVFENRAEVFRRYSIVPGAGDEKHDPYVIRHETTFRNLTDQTLVVPSFSVAIGTAAPNNAADIGQFLTTGLHTADKFEFVDRSNLEGRGFLGFGAKGPIPYIISEAPITWASVQNQFFAGILTPDTPGRQLITRRIELPAFPGSPTAAVGITGAVSFEAPSLLPKGEKVLGMNYYAGPKEFKRLGNADIFKNDEDRVMNFGFTRWFSALLLSMMTGIHGFVGSWGLAIILTTLSLKFLLLPLTLSASKSAKRMQKIQPQLTALREKFKDNPQKLNQATMELFKTAKVNPLGGCLPVLVTIPFFWGFFRMLPSAAELRFVPFLWSSDLSAADTVGHVFGFPINIMPVLLGVTMIFQQRVTPQPTVDNAQAKMFKFMPYIFAFFCYNFSAALSLYSTVNGTFTILQQLFINRMKDKDEPVASPTGKPLKNVTPKK